MFNVQALANQHDASVLLYAVTDLSQVLAGCSQDVADKMLDILAMTTVRLQLLQAIAEEIENAFNSFDDI